MKKLMPGVRKTLSSQTFLNIRHSTNRGVLIAISGNYKKAHKDILKFRKVVTNSINDAFFSSNDPWIPLIIFQNGLLFVIPHFLDYVNASGFIRSFVDMLNEVSVQNHDEIEGLCFLN